MPDQNDKKNGTYYYDTDTEEIKRTKESSYDDQQATSSQCPSIEDETAQILSNLQRNDDFQQATYAELTNPRQLTALPSDAALQQGPSLQQPYSIVLQNPTQLTALPSDVALQQGPLLQQPYSIEHPNPTQPTELPSDVASQEATANLSSFIPTEAEKAAHKKQRHIQIFKKKNGFSPSEELTREELNLARSYRRKEYHRNKDNSKKKQKTSTNTESIDALTVAINIRKKRTGTSSKDQKKSRKKRITVFPV